MEKAIKLAIEGGYNKMSSGFDNDKYEMRCLLDPLFWQCLGKAMGWDNDAPNTTSGYEFSPTGWETYWHRFVSHLAKGKQAEEFFNDLLK